LGSLRLVEGLWELEIGYREHDGRRTLYGLTNLALGCEAAVRHTARAVGAVGLGLWLWLALWDLKAASRQVGLKEEVGALGRIGAALGWLLPYLSEGATVAASASVLGIGGTGVMALKSIWEFVAGYRKGAVDKQFEALTSLGLDLGLLFSFLGLPTAATALLLGSMVPLVLRKLSGRVDGFIDRALRASNRCLDPIARPLERFIAPLRRAYVSLVEKDVKPAERTFIAQLVDRPWNALRRTFSPLGRALYACGGKQLIGVLDGFFRGVGGLFSSVERCLDSLLNRWFPNSGNAPDTSTKQNRSAAVPARAAGKA
jgi:hypothetical protein